MGRWHRHSCRSGPGGRSNLERPLPPDTEARLASFTELVAAAIANAESRAALGQLAEEQGARPRVATLVAQAAPPEEVFAAVAEEVGQLFRVELAALLRYEPGRTAISVTTWGTAGENLPGWHPVAP